jgi:hypothetical protein
MLKNRFTWIGVALLGTILIAWALPSRPAETSVFTYGKADVQSLGVLAFGPENVLLAGDSKGAAVFALEVESRASAAGNTPLNVQELDRKIAAMVGTTADGITINDMAVHPVSQQVYLSVTRGQGDAAVPVLLRVTKAGALEEVSLDNIGFSKGMIANAPAADAVDNRGRSLRTNAISDLAYADGQVYVAGLSNEEFASNLRQLSYPFTANMKASSLEIFHVSHGQYETHAPVRTFMPYTLNGQPHILAAYTCTPLVAFPVSDLANGAHVKGKTVAELGAGNTPLDIVSFERGGRTHILIANTNRGVMLLDAADIPEAQDLTQPSDAETLGVSYTTLPWSGVTQLAMLNNEQVLVLERQGDGGPLHLRSYATSQL